MEREKLTGDFIGVTRILCVGLVEILNLHKTNILNTRYTNKTTKIHFKFKNSKHKPNVN